MKEGRNLRDLAGELHRQLATKKDYTAHTSMLSLTINPETGMRLNGLNGEDVGITNHCHGQIASRLKIPKQYYDRMLAECPELLSENVNHWFKAKNEQRMVRLMDGNARAFLSNRYRPIDNFDLAEIALPKIEKIGCKLESCELTNSRMYLKATTEKIQGEVKVGDVVQAGLMVSNSEIGAGSVQVMPLIYRLNCSNGMIIQDRGTRKYHTGRWVQELEDAVKLFSDETIKADNKAFLMKVEDIMEGALAEDTFQSILQNLTITADNKIETHPEKVVKEITEKFQMNEEEGGSVLRHLIDGGDLSQWGLANAVTRASQDVPDYDKATDFERIGGEIVHFSEAQWKEVATAK